MNEIQNSIMSNGDLAGKLKELWNAGAEPSKIVDALAETGITASQEEVEGLLSELQEKHAQDISQQKLDDAELERVAGGGMGICDGTDNCDSSFQTHPQIDKADRCFMSYYCDSYYDDICGYPYD